MKGPKQLLSEYPVLPALIVAMLLALAVMGIVLVAARAVSWYMLEPRAATNPWKRNVQAEACDVEDSAGPWLALRCGARNRLTLPTGIFLSSDGKEDKPPINLRELFQVRRGAQGASVQCHLVDVSNGTRYVPFADCTLDGQDLSLLLLSAGAFPPPPDDSAAWASLSPAQQTALPGPVLRTRPSAETRRSSSIAIQGWIATLVGLLGAGAAFAYSAAENARRSRDKREFRRSMAEWDLNELCHLEDALREPVRKERITKFRKILKRLRKNLVKYLEHDMQRNTQLPKLFVDLRKTLDAVDSTEDQRLEKYDELSKRLQRVLKVGERT